MNAPNRLHEALILGGRTDYLENIRKSAAIQKAHIERAAEALSDWAKRPDSEWSELVFLDAFSFLGIDSIPDRMDDIRHDLSIDEEGYSLTDEGFRKERADRRWVPLKALGS